MNNITIIDDDVRLCADCVQPAVNGDFTSLDYHYSAREADERMSAITAGLEALGYITPWADDDGDHDEDEFSSRPCECCGCTLAGMRLRFVQLGEAS